MKKEYYAKLREQREKNNLTYKMMADKVNLSVGYYWQLENKQKNLYYSMAMKIADVFNLKPDDLFYEKK